MLLAPQPLAMFFSTWFCHILVNVAQTWALVYSSVNWLPSSNHWTDGKEGKRITDMEELCFPWKKHAIEILSLVWQRWTSHFVLERTLELGYSVQRPWTSSAHVTWNLWELKNLNLIPDLGIWTYVSQDPRVTGEHRKGEEALLKRLQKGRAPETLVSILYAGVPCIVSAPLISESLKNTHRFNLHTSQWGKLRLRNEMTCPGSESAAQSDEKHGFWKSLWLWVRQRFRYNTKSMIHQKNDKWD